jgi:hypothetical protein
MIRWWRRRAIAVEATPSIVSDAAERTPPPPVLISLRRSPKEWGSMDPRAIIGGDTGQIVETLEAAQQDILRLVAAAAGYSSGRVTFK